MAGMRFPDVHDELLERPGPPVPVPPVPSPRPPAVPEPVLVPAPTLPLLTPHADEACEEDDEAMEWLRELLPGPPPLSVCTDAESTEWLRELITWPSAQAIAPVPAAPAVLVPAAPAVPVDRIRHRSRSGRRAPPALPAPPLALWRTASRPSQSSVAKGDGGGGGCGSSSSSSSAGRSFSTVSELASAFPDATVLPVPRQGDVVRDFLALSDMPATPASPSASLDAPLASCLGRLARWLLTFDAVMVFKVGIAHDPVHRWTNPDYGYIRDRVWCTMDLVFAGTSDECRRLEIGLIAATRGLPGCRNERPGGEGIAPGSTSGAACYVYFVVAGAGDGLGLNVAWARRDIELRDRFINLHQKSAPEVC